MNDDDIVVDEACIDIYKLQVTVILKRSYYLEQLNKFHCYKNILYCRIRFIY